MNLHRDSTSPNSQRRERIGDGPVVHEVRDENGKVVGRYMTGAPMDSEARHRMQRAEIDALDAGRGYEAFNFDAYAKALRAVVAPETVDQWAVLLEGGK